ncbi:unnamed protein product [Durusdinium trenchii]|uniref:Uncharacterized protein n=1 Tax=Durusdinium trenchii TaxID=1381693 RepID=A0ABP0HJE8_9DINO
MATRFAEALAVVRSMALQNGQLQVTEGPWRISKCLRPPPPSGVPRCRPRALGLSRRKSGRPRARTAGWTCSSDPSLARSSWAAATFAF